MKDKLAYLKYNDIEYPMLFSLNVMEDIQEKYGELDNWLKLIEKDGEPNIKDLKYGLWLMIKDGIEAHNEANKNNQLAPISERTVGRIVTVNGLAKTATIMNQLIIDSTKLDDPKNE